MQEDHPLGEDKTSLPEEAPDEALESGEDSQASERSDEELLADAHAFVKLVEEAENDNRIAALEDLEFAAGEQWPMNVKSDRALDGRPCLVINRLPQFIQQLTNDQRQNRPSIKTHPVDDTADVETAKIINGLVRHIEYNSNADAAYDTGFEFAAKSGWGYWRVVTDYRDPLTFKQEIFIRRIRNPFSVYFDPYAQEPDGSDASKAAITEDYSPEEYRARFPNSKLAQKDAWDSAGNDVPDWMEGGSARVAEFFYKDTREEDIVLLDTGESMLKREYHEFAAQHLQRSQAAQQLDPLAEPASLPQVVRERRTLVPVIKWCKLNAVEILEKTEWPGKYIPIVPVYGSDQFINGKRVLKGIIRDAKDSQRMYNYWASAETEAIALAPRAPFIGYEGQFEGREGEWATANRRNHPYLQVKPISIGGQPAPLPQRNAFEPAVQAITQARMMAAEDLKSTTGIYDASLGAKSNESSGIAIQRRNQQAQTSNFHFVDNLTRSIKHTGRILIDLIPRIYDTADVARIIGEDGEQKVVKINQPTGEVGKDGKPLLYNLSVGKYDVTVDVGPSYASKRQEAVASMIDFVKAYPAAAQIIPDLLAKNMDWPGASEISERFKKTLPPNLLEDSTKQQQIPPQVQAQLAQMGQMLEQLQKDRADLLSERESRLIEVESKERIEMAKLETQATIELAKLESKESLNLLAHQIAELDARTKQLHITAPFPGMGAGPEQDMPPEQEAGAYPGAEFGDGGLHPTGGDIPPGSPLDEGSFQ